MKKLVRATLVTSLLVSMLLYTNSHNDCGTTKFVPNGTPTSGVSVELVPDLDILQTESYNTDIVASEEPMVYEMSETDISEEIWCDDLELLALTTLAEAEGEPEIGKRLVIDTILNRVDSDRYPNSIHEVIYAPNQFTIFDNGRINRVQINDDICRLVLEELDNRTNSEVLYFNAIGFNNWSTPMFDGPVGNHYFSK